MPEDEVNLNLEAQTVCMLLEQLQALASGARLMVDTALRAVGLSTLVGVEAAEQSWTTLSRSMPAKRRRSRNLTVNSGAPIDLRGVCYGSLGRPVPVGRNTSDGLLATALA